MVMSAEENRVRYRPLNPSPTRLRRVRQCPAIVKHPDVAAVTVNGYAHIRRAARLDPLPTISMVLGQLVCPDLLC